MEIKKNDKNKECVCMKDERKERNKRKKAKQEGKEWIIQNDFTKDKVAFGE